MKSLPRVSYAAMDMGVKESAEKVTGNGYTAIRYVDSGKLEVTILGEKYVAESGEYIITPAGVPYEYKTEGNGLISMVSFFLDEGIEELVKKEDIEFEHSENYIYVELESLFIPIQGKISIFDASYKHLKSIISTYDKATEYINISAASDCVQLFISLAKDNILNIVDAEGEKYRHQLLCDRIDKYISENYSKPITMTTISSLVIMHENYIGYVYKNIRGITIMQHLKNVRMEIAKKLLSTNKYRVSQVAKMVGYSDTRYFITIFRKAEKISPGKYYDNFQKERVFSYDVPKYLDPEEEGVY